MVRLFIQSMQNNNLALWCYYIAIFSLYFSFFDSFTIHLKQFSISNFVFQYFMVNITMYFHISCPKRLHHISMYFHIYCPKHLHHIVDIMTIKHNMICSSLFLISLTHIVSAGDVLSPLSVLLVTLSAVPVVLMYERYHTT